jgi:hypothetical protein
MTATVLFTTLITAGCQFRIEGGILHIRDPQHALTNDLRQAIREHKTTLLALLREHAATNPLTDIAPKVPTIDLNTPLENLQEPVHIWSNILQDDCWVCATKGQAAQLAHGKAVYLPGEMRTLRAMKERSPRTFAEKLQMIHQAKQTFGATLEHVSLPQRHPEPAQREHARPGARQTGDRDAASASPSQYPTMASTRSQ